MEVEGGLYDIDVMSPAIGEKRAEPLYLSDSLSILYQQEGMQVVEELLVENAAPSCFEHVSLKVYHHSSQVSLEEERAFQENWLMEVLEQHWVFHSFQQEACLVKMAVHFLRIAHSC